MYQAFGWEPPAFAHVGLLLDKNKQKLSKRTGSKDISTYRETGIFPETLTNFVALLGWSHNVGKDIMSMEDLIHNARIPSFIHVNHLMSCAGQHEIHTRRLNS